MISGDTPAFTITQFLISLVAIVGAIVATGGVLWNTPQARNRDLNCRSWRNMLARKQSVIQTASK